MIINLSEQHSLVNNWVSELRDIEIQSDRMRFRRNLERIAEVAACEISKNALERKEVTTPLGTSTGKVLSSNLYWLRSYGPDWPCTQFAELFRQGRQCVHQRLPQTQSRRQF